MEILIKKNDNSKVEFSSIFGLAIGEWKSYTIPIVGEKYSVEINIPNFKSIEKSKINKPFMVIKDEATNINMFLSSKEDDLFTFYLNDFFIEMLIDCRDDLILGEHYLISTSNMEIFDCNY